MKKTVFNFLILFPCLLLSIEMYSQDRNVKGTVVSKSEGTTLPGVTVTVKGTKNNTSTDFDGSFSINVAGADATLVFSYVGYKTTERLASISNKIIVSMVENTEQLKEVKVTTGYEKTSQRTYTGAINKISEKDLKVEGVVDVSRMIEGKAAGVTVQNVTGSFGTAPKITIRGSSSIFGDTKPLWVIDGVVNEDIINFTLADLTSGNSATLLSSAVAGLNANDILSVEILKDAAATSIYGSRSLNGVVVITTKQGKKDTPLKINYSLEQTVRAVPSYGQYDILNSQETMSIISELDRKGFLPLPDAFQGRNGGIYNIMARALNNYDSNTNTFSLKNDAVSRNEFLRKYEFANTDWFNVLFRSSLTQNHTMSFSGGGKSSTYYASLGYYVDPGWSIADNVKRITSNIKATIELSSKVNLTLSTLASIRKQGAPGSYDRQKDEFRGGATRDFDINPFYYALNTNRTLRPYDENGNLEYYRNNWAPINILNELKNNFMEIKVNDIKFQADLDYKITPDLTYNLTTSARYANTVREHNIFENSNIVKAYNAAENTVVRDANIFLFQDPDNLNSPKVSVLPAGGILRKFSNDLISYNIRNSFNYKKTINEKHELEGLFGQEIRSLDRNSDNFTSYGLQYDKGYTANPDPRILQKLITDGNSYYGLEKERERTIGFFGKVNYTYDRRYTGSVTGRYDGSNRQGNSSSSRWLPTYTFSGKWNAKEEDFLKDNKFISRMSLRGSYGLTASAGPATNSLAIYKSLITDRLNLNDREISQNIKDLQNTELTWEKQFETNLGLDLGFFDNRVQLTTDIYSRKAFDLVDYVVTSGVGGQKIKQGNNANMATKGIELGLTTQNIVSSSFKWSTTVNFSVYNQEITSLQNTPKILGLVDGTGGNLVGHPRNSLYSYQFTGLTSDGLPTFILPDAITDKIGGADFEDTKNPAQYLKYEGSIEPNKSLGISNTFTYENWSLNVFIVASGGNKIRLNPLFTVNTRGNSGYSDLSVFTKDFTNRWINPGDELVTNVPKLAAREEITLYDSNGIDLAKAYNAYNYSDVRVADGDFVRLKNISLTYEFPKLLKKSIGVSSFNLKFLATNPLLIYSDKRLNGEDPEFFRSGGVSLPITAQYSFVLNLSL
jgi:TonB-linked SusC/RagA family outer membrane protein